MTEDRTRTGRDAAVAAEMTIHWDRLANEQGQPMLWFGSWLVGDKGGEGEWFYSGRGGESTRHHVPPDASGVRIRSWPAEALPEEYVDLPLGGEREIHTAELNFDERQPHSRLPGRVA